MDEIIVVYRLDQPVKELAHADEAPGEGPAVLEVHAAPAAPGAHSVPGPRTLCGKDTVNMRPAPWKPSGPGFPWYDPQYAHKVCEACDTAMES
ncbi:hypothetical protein NLX86_17190 [Streptomyces sp. A3M-1-3]|uniref:hypothetical protein n=1 Tax=Streptomyces sp. A3M-1-3 TaxID=2962044 RepID=UPI0020B8049A|nr:hypothetical protein [Streptomyces sp. A3M-1-3]MCP3819768.1 hypothetical protein [Streptomyces sp. A3M-1-3]